MRPNIAILGSGAAAAFAYKACVDYKCKNVEVYTDRMGQPTKGAFFLYWIPDDLATKHEPTEITFVGMGTVDQYIKHQWGEADLGSSYVSSFPSLPFIIAGWSADLVWEDLWKGASINIIADRFSDTDLKDLAKFHDIIFLTFPTQESLQVQREYLVRIPIQMAGTDLPPIPQMAMPILRKWDNFIIYNGTETWPWVRMSRMWGQTFYEYSHSFKCDETDKAMIYQTDLMPNVPKWKKMLAKNLIPIGRFAKWDRQYLSHQAYTDAKTALIMWDEGYREFKEII